MAIAAELALTWFQRNTSSSLSEKKLYATSSINTADKLLQKVPRISMHKMLSAYIIMLTGMENVKWDSVRNFITTVTKTSFNHQTDITYTYISIYMYICT